MTQQLLLIPIIIALVVSCQLIEIYAYFIKGASSKTMGRQLMGLANWIQYFARILYVLVLIILAYVFEVLELRYEILTILFLSVSISALLSMIFIFYKNISKLFNIFLYPLVAFTYKDLLNVTYNLTKGNSINYKLFSFSFISSYFIGLAFFLPFVVSVLYPDYRMLATYSGQFLNFFATAVTFSIVEPILFKFLDGANSKEFEVCSNGKTIILSKITALYFLAITIFCVKHALS